jgi:hypothetical protein
MSVISWITPRGDLGTVPENFYYRFQLEAVDSDQQPLFYSFISGTLPGGMYVTREGELRGIPTILSSVNQKSVSTFTIRATNPNGTVADRSFSLTVSNINGPQIIPRPDLIGAYFDGSLIDYSFAAVNDNPNAIQTWSIIQGSIPPGLTFSSDGRLYGYADIIAQNVSDLGFEAAPNESVIFDALPVSADKFYNFTVQVSDDLKVDTVNVRLLIVSKGNFTADSTAIAINNTFITVDADNEYIPIILNNPESLPVLVSGSTFAYKFVAYDPEDEPISWAIDELEASGMDDLDAAVDQLLAGNGTGTSYVLDQTPLNETRIVVFVNDVRLTGLVDYTLSGATLTFTSLTPTVDDIIYVQFISITTGFDTLVFDQGAEGLPASLVIDVNTGWVLGSLPTQVPEYATYTFDVVAYRRINPQIRSRQTRFTITSKRGVNEEIVWTTPFDLGVIDNGAVSELSIDAYNTYGKELYFEVIYNPFRKLPQGLKFLRTGKLIGRVTFRYFALDGQTAELNITSTQDLSVGMSVQGAGVAAGCKITEIVDSNTIRVAPAIYVDQGTILVFSNDVVQKSASTTSNAISTAIDGGTTTFDQQCGFTVRATAVDGSITATHDFTLTVSTRNLAPYENVYLKALPSYAQRLTWENLRKNETVFPPDLLYRPEDFYFGVQSSLKSLFLAGLSVGTAESFVNTISRNHYLKRINFGEIKTARAVNENDGSIDYEVVYVDLIDDQAFGTSGPPLEVELAIANSFLINNQSYNVIYPNSFPNMQKRIETGKGYTNRSSLPRWMSSVQENGTVLGLIRCVVLAYTQPGASQLIAYRIKNSGFEINQIAFVADRYQWDNYLTRFFNIESNQFLPSVPTTFDKYVSTQEIGSAVVDTVIVNSVTNSNTVSIPSTVRVGYGWQIQSREDAVLINTNTFVSNLNVTGNILTLSKTVTSGAGGAIRISGEAFADYAVSVSFNSIDGENLSYVRSNFLIDGRTDFEADEKLIFAKQSGFDEINDGWIDVNGNSIPGYLEKVGGQSTINYQGGIWKFVFTEFTDIGLDDDDYGFDQEEDNLSFSHFDQGNDSEIRLVFEQEMVLNQTIKIRTGDTYKISTLQYETILGESIPAYTPFRSATGNFRQAETTFDGGTCIMREGYVPGTSVTGGTRFSNNKDIWIVPETLDKYIKFPQIGVFV